MAKKKTAKKPTSTSDSKKTVLTIDQQKKVRKLLKSKDAKNIKLAIGLLQSTDATNDDWSQSFSSTVISQLVNTWDCDVWNAVAAGLHPFSGLLKEFMGLAAERYLKLSGPKQDSFICLILSNCEPPLSSVIDAILKKQQGNLWLSGLTSLSDAAAEGLSKYEGWLGLDGITSLSDAAAESLSKHEGDLDLRGLTTLSDAAIASLLGCEADLYLNGWVLPTYSETAKALYAKLAGRPNTEPEGPSIRVICSECWKRDELELMDMAAGEAFENSARCLERAGWSWNDELLCDDCTPWPK